MASLGNSETFRFLDLPKEIRDKIYRNLLCTFGSRPTTRNRPVGEPDSHFFNDLAVVEHAVDTSILFTSKQIHREAYDTMVKTNRFVRVTTPGDIPLRLCAIGLFDGSKQLGDAYKGTLFSVEPCSFMFLSRDMGVFCDILMDGATHINGFGTRVVLKIDVAPGSILDSSPYKYPISDFFSETTQLALLRPFRSHLRGFKKVKVRGLVARNIAEVVEEEIASDMAASTYPGKIEEASMLWLDAALEIDQLHHGSSWPSPTVKGGVPFVARVAELYLLLRLNIIQTKLLRMEKGDRSAGLLAEDSIKMAELSLRKGYWMSDFRWQPKDVHKAKLRYRHEVLRRMVGDPNTINLAVTLIDSAHRLLPEDAGIMREQDMISDWQESVSYGMP
ncbi:hypothetical protein OPT61_g3822 [Boeremia exigua]|uniref:Uncharacterized protein n=1 Tax=Boeremia exigua TaxID=749465 RepID=A0ACC2IGL2_9PLEO|nr:hypothetical protein OPT61_g3822 [Boeremia exigua]